MSLSSLGAETTKETYHESYIYAVVGQPNLAFYSVHDQADYSEEEHLSAGSKGVDRTTSCHVRPL